MARGRGMRHLYIWRHLRTSFGALAVERHPGVRSIKAKVSAGAPDVWHRMHRLTPVPRGGYPEQDEKTSKCD